MNMKPLAMLALSGLIAVSFAYTAPAMAQDTNNGSSMQAPSDNSGATDNNGGDNNSPSSNDNNGGSDNTTSDQGSPDTATGDDDY